MILEGVILLGVFLAYPSERQTAVVFRLFCFALGCCCMFSYDNLIGIGLFMKVYRDQRFAEGWVEKVQRFVLHRAGYFF
jgi:hypothetical protein